ncbi:YceI family protein [Bradyrhizobium manausense]|uniref:YceI family protein n=1 Tax=Bradyrhizobium manausense TaxID=989370 RepID=UPI00201231B3|nr:YceI family protein [Bradyrhizobium manausense]
MLASANRLLALTTTLVLMSSPGSRATTFDIDIVHSHVAFFIDHLGFSKVIGTVNDISGSFDFDANKPEASKLSATLKVSSISTNSKQRDGDIQGADWFNAAEFPDIVFVGKTFAKTAEQTGTILGDLTIAGVTRPVTLNVVFNREGQNPWDKSHVVGFSARTSIKRSDFGMKTAIPMIGDQVDLFFEVEGRGRS